MEQLFIVLDHVGRSISNSALTNISIKDIKPSKIDDHQTYGCKEEIKSSK